MSENPINQRDIKNDEIDLLDLFNRMGKAIARGVRAIWRAILISAVFIIRNWLPILISIMLGVALSHLKTKSAPSIYTTDMVLRNNAYKDIPNDRLIQYINRLQSIDRTSLSQLLGVSEHTADNVTSISAYWIIDLNKDKIPDHIDYSSTHDIYDTTNIRMPDRVNISVRIKSPQDLDDLRDGIIRSIENDPAFSQINKQRLYHTEDLLKRVNIDIQDIDSLQKSRYLSEKIERRMKTEGQVVFMQEQLPQLYYKDIHKLFEMKQKMEDDLSLYRNITTVIDDFSVPKIRVNGFSFYAKKYIPVFLLVTLLLLIIISNFRGLKETYRKYR